LNIVFIVIVLFSLFVSTLTCIWILKIRKKKWLVMVVAFCVNTLILSIATVLLYQLDILTFRKQTDGLFDSLGILVLVFFIPIITFINFYILEFVRNRSMSTPN